MDASTTTSPSYLRPALIGGLAMGVLSALPVISVANLCCCLWFVSGGLVASYLLQQDRAAPLSPGDGAMVGLLAGLIGAVVTTALSIPIDLIMGPMSRAAFERLAETGDLPPNVRDMLENFGQNGMGVAGIVVVRGIMFVLLLMVGGFFATLGGLLGSVLFSKRSPAAPPPDPRFG